MHRWDWFPTWCISQVKTGSYTEKDSDNNTTIEKMIMKKDMILHGNSKMAGAELEEVV